MFERLSWILILTIVKYLITWKTSENYYKSWSSTCTACKCYCCRHCLHRLMISLYRLKRNQKSQTLLRNLLSDQAWSLKWACCSSSSSLALFLSPPSICCRWSKSHCCACNCAFCIWETLGTLNLTWGNLKCTFSNTWLITNNKVRHSTQRFSISLNPSCSLLCLICYAFTFSSVWAWRIDTKNVSAPFHRLKTKLFLSKPFF